MKIGIFKVVPEDTTEDQLEQHTEDVRATAEAVEDYLLRYFGPDSGIQVLGYAWPYDKTELIKPSSVPYIASFQHEADLLTFADQIGTFDDYITIGGYANYCGQAYRGSGFGVTYDIHGCGKVKTTIHELLHADPDWALGHAGGFETEYGGLLNLMGTITTVVHGLHGPHLAMLGLIEEYPITEAQTVRLATVEMSPYSLWKDERQLLSIGDYQLSMRTTSTPHRFALPATYAGRIFVHLVETNRSTHRTEWDMDPGDEITLGKFTIKYTGFDDTREQAELEITENE